MKLSNVYTIVNQLSRMTKYLFKTKNKIFNLKQKKILNKIEFKI